jgi:hypothetical protein
MDQIEQNIKRQNSRDRQRKYRENNRAKIIERQRQYRERNRELTNQKQREYRKKIKIDNDNKEDNVYKEKINNSIYEIMYANIETIQNNFTYYEDYEEYEIYEV